MPMLLYPARQQKQMTFVVIGTLTVYLIETPFNTFANRADYKQAALVRAVWSGSTLFAHGKMIYLILH